MLTRFFATSKPINFVVITLVVLVFFGTFYVSGWMRSPDLHVIFSELAIMGVFLLTLGVLNFVVKKNTLTKKNTYIIYFFALFSMALPVAFSQPRVMLAGLFIMLALRRIISLRSLTNVKKKVFDAAFWIFIASLFYFWSIFFLGVLYLGIVFHVAGDYKNWLLPLLALFVVGICTMTYAMYTDGILDFIIKYVQVPSYDFRNYNRARLLIPATFFLTIYLWCVFKYLGLVRAVSQKLRPSYTLVLLSSIIAFLITIGFSPYRDGSEMYFILGPLAIIASRYIEKSESMLFGEMLLWMTLLMPMLLVVYF